MINLSVFSERLKEYMSDKNLNAPALAKQIGAERSTINGLERGAFIPSTKIFVKLITYFNCSADYLLGREEYPREEKFSPITPVWERVDKLLYQANKNKYCLKKDLNISTSVIQRWSKAVSVPSIESVDKLADYFDVSVDFLLGRVD